MDVQLQDPEAREDVTEGDDVTLKCQAEGSGELLIEWFRYDCFVKYFDCNTNEV